MIDRKIAYFPGDTPLFEGPVIVSEVELGEPGPATWSVVLEEDPKLDFEFSVVSRRSESTIYRAGFLRQLGEVICHVDNELDPQPTKEEVARAILASEWAD